MPRKDGTGPAGFGKGRNRGIGRGKGVGRGTGGGYRGMGNAMNMSNPSITGTIGSQMPNNPVIPINMLENSNEQVIKEKEIDMVAIVDTERCVGCALCADVCPEDAISVNDLAVIDREKCTGCGTCVAECPQDAISLIEI